VPDIKNVRLNAKPAPEMYLPFAQMSSPFLDLAIRTSGDPKRIVSALRAELRQIDRDLPLASFETMDEVISGNVAMPRFQATLLGGFAGLALLLAAVGIHGVIAYSVSLRTHEIGIRMAMGARREDILRLVLAGGMAAPLAGVVLGAAGAAAAARLIGSFLYGVRPLDPATYIVVGAAVLAAALVAAWIPARRAMAVDPLVSLRYE